MLTITPPETREDEIQVDETDDRNLMLRLSPTRLNAKRKERNAHGFNYIQLIVGMIIFVALSRIVGPPAFRMITRARSTALSANIQTAAETVRNVLAIDPAKRGTVGTNGAPDPIFIAALTDDAPFNWQTDWQLTADDDSDTIRVQFIGKTASATPTAAAAGADEPKVYWLLNAFDAVRIQAKNQDGAFACALIVLKPAAANLDTNDDDEVAVAGTDNSTAAATDVAVDLANAHLRGIWYDTAENYVTTGVAPASRVNGVDHCSPVVYDATTPTAPLPASASGWTIGTAALTRNA